MALVMSVSMGAHAGQNDAADGELSLHPRFTKRCRALDLVRVPDDWPIFEAQIIRWIGTCVTSRSGNARREVTLVRASKTLLSLWQSLTKGKPARIVPSYIWGSFRVERIEFLSPQAKGTHSQSRTPSPGSTPGGVPPTSAKYSQYGNQPGPRPGQHPRKKPSPPTVRPPGTIPDGNIWLPHEGDDLLFDARRLVEQLRADGKEQDVRNLEQKVKVAGKVLVSLALLAGTYYVGTKIRSGKLLIMWGWNATGGDYARVAARVQRLIPEVESALQDVVNTARPHIPPGGSGGEGWRVLDQIVDGTVPAQLDDAACGPACVQMALRDRDIEMAQDELIRRARAANHPGLNARHVRARRLHTLLQKLDPDGRWQVGQPLTDEFLDGKNARQIIEALGKNGSWIAQVSGHFVMVDGIDAQGYIRIRDPWYEPGLARGIRAGSHYRVSMGAFFDVWLAVAVYRW